MATKSAPQPGIPKGTGNTMMDSVKILEARLNALIEKEVDHAIRTGNIRKQFAIDVKKVLVAWRNEAVVFTNDELTALYKREMNRLGSYYSGKVKGIKKPAPPEVFASQLRAIDDVANNVFNNALNAVQSAQAAHELLKVA